MKIEVKLKAEAHRTQPRHGTGDGFIPNLARGAPESGEGVRQEHLVGQPKYHQSGSPLQPLQGALRRLKLGHHLSGPGNRAGNQPGKHARVSAKQDGRNRFLIPPVHIRQIADQGKHQITDSWQRQRQQPAAHQYRHIQRDASPEENPAPPAHTQAQHPVGYNDGKHQGHRPERVKCNKDQAGQYQHIFSPLRAAKIVYNQKNRQKPKQKV